MGASFQNGLGNMQLYNNLADIGNAFIRAQNQNAQNSINAQWASAQAAMQHAAAEAQKQREWQEMMSNTAYQRAVKDMKAAGLNPILAFSQGGASSPQGASAGGYTINGAHGQVDARAAMLSAMPSIMSSLQEIATDAFSKANPKSIPATINNMRGMFNTAWQAFTEPFKKASYVYNSDLTAGAQPK